MGVRMFEDAHADPLYSVNLLLRRNLYRDFGWEVTALAGYRFLRLDEDLRIREDLIWNGYCSLHTASITGIARVIELEQSDTHNRSARPRG